MTSIHSANLVYSALSAEQAISIVFRNEVTFQAFVTGVIRLLDPAFRGDCG